MNLIINLSSSRKKSDSVKCVLNISFYFNIFGFIFINEMIRREVQPLPDFDSNVINNIK